MQYVMYVLIFSFLVQQFSKENGRYIQENKLRVVLVSPPHSPVVEPITGVRQEPALENPDSAETCIFDNGALQHEAADEVPILRKTSVLHNGAPKHEAIHENPLLQKACISSNQVSNEVPDIISSPVYLLPKNPRVSTKVRNLVAYQCIDQLSIWYRVVPNIPVLYRIGTYRAYRAVQYGMDLLQAEKTIMSLRKENNATMQEGEKLQQEIALLRRKSSARVKAGFPFLFVVFIAFVGMKLGYLWHS
ncbi:hypothetical protein BHM03_00046746 [Ensete ventricosum]|nr:hypothetical protein BHM03_00046746 [Ensete ventricosum]